SLPLPLPPRGRESKNTVEEPGYWSNLSGPMSCSQPRGVPRATTMKRLIIDVAKVLLVLGASSAHGTSPNPRLPPELKKLDVWVGNWSLSGTARDQPDGREYSLRWTLHERWVLNRSFLQVDQTWKGNGQTQRSLEMLSYDPVK